MGGRMHPGWAPTPPEDLWRMTQMQHTWALNEEEHLTQRLAILENTGAEEYVIKLTRSLLESTTERRKALHARFLELDEKSVLL